MEEMTLGEITAIVVLWMGLRGIGEGVFGASTDSRGRIAGSCIAGRVCWIVGGTDGPRSSERTPGAAVQTD